MRHKSLFDGIFISRVKKRDNIVLFVFKITCKVLLAKEPIFKTARKRSELCRKRDESSWRGNEVVKPKSC